jgi:hypothetical protein
LKQKSFQRKKGSRNKARKKQAEQKLEIPLREYFSSKGEKIKSIKED